MSWFALIIFLRIPLCLAQERLLAVANLGNPNKLKAFLVLLLILLCLNISLACTVMVVLREGGWSIVALVVFENVNILLECLNVGLKYLLHFLSFHHHHIFGHLDAYIYTSDFLVSSAIEFVSLAHFLHVWTWNGISFTLVDIFLFMHTRSVLLSLYHRLIAYHTYSMGIDIIFADATEHDLGTTEMCVICHDPLSSAKKLHCGHMFHGNCIRQWTQYKLLCPICRTCFCKSCTAKTEGRNIDQLSFLRRTIAWISWRFSSSPCASFLTAPARGSNLEQNEVF